MKKPNLFDFATSELSQDAFICWLLTWSSPEYKSVDEQLHNCGTELLKAMFAKHGKTLPEQLYKVEVKKQYKNIDVLCIVNETFAIIIEDKTWTKQHSDQLRRYYDMVKNESDSVVGLTEDNILPIYFKTQDQSNFESVLVHNYQPFLRQDCIEVLKSYQGNNHILVDFRTRLESIEEKIQAYIHEEPDAWSWYNWVGFYQALKVQLQGADWSYVANPSGGFLGLWWHFKDADGCLRYIQLESQKKNNVNVLCFKIKVESDGERKKLRNHFHNMTIDDGKQRGFQLKKPTRFGSGKYMTVAVLEGDYRVINNGKIDFNGTVARLKALQEIIA